MNRPIKILKQALIVMVTASVLLSPADIKAGDYTAAWTRLLREVVIDGLVDYGALWSRREELNAVKDMWRVQAPDDTADAASRMAYWINGYNILILCVVMDHWPLKRRWGLDALRYPSESIQQIPHVWDGPVLGRGNRFLSLNDIEHVILRKGFGDPRVHFALVCASRGCPPLRGESYEPSRLDEQLNDQIRRFLSNPEKARYDPAEDTLYLSPIFKWFAGDFDQTGGVRGFIRAHAPWPSAALINDGTRIRWLSYDWSLNRTP